MYLKDTSCCAIQEICQLSAHKTALEAMLVFCNSNLGKPVYFGKDPGYKKHLYSFYLFTAGRPISGYAYGEEFAKLIRENKLGDVIETKDVTNLAYHPGHTNKVWIWTVDQKALEAWWKENKK